MAGVKTQNLFDLLGSDVEDEEVVAPVETEAPVEAKAKDAPQPVAGSVAAGVQARMNRAPAGGREGERGRGRGGRGSRGRGYDRPYGREGVENAAGESAAEHGGDARSGGGRGRGRGGEGRRGRRDYDRQDGTGRGHETEKKQGAGKGNWGALDEEQKGEEEETPTAEDKAPETEAPAEGEAAEKEAAPAAEPEKEEMTLDEYEKLMAEKRANLKGKKGNGTAAPQPDMQAFKGMKAVTARKDSEEDDELGLTNKRNISGRKTGTFEKGRKEKEMVQTSFRVGESPEAGDRPRRGRGEGRGGRGDGRGRSGFGRGEGRGRGEFRGEGRGRGEFRGEGRGRGEFRGEGRGRGGGERRNGPYAGPPRPSTEAPVIVDEGSFPALG